MSNTVWDIVTLQNSLSDVLHNFQQVVFHTHNTVFVFITFKRLLLFKSLIVTTAEVYKFHALINRSKEKTLQWSYNVIASKLQCDTFKLLK